MSRVVLDIIVVLIIILIGGFFAGSEMALVSLREGQVRALSKRGRRGQRAAPLLDRIAVLARPVVWLLTKCTNLIVALLGGDPRLGRLAITEEELRDLVTGAQTLSQDERHIVGEVFDAGKRQIREVIVPRTEVVFLDAETPVAEAAAIAAGVPHSPHAGY